MRTWFNALPPAHHAPTASIERRKPEQPFHDKKRAAVPVQPVNRYALAKKDGLPRGDHRPPDGCAISLEGIRGQAQLVRLPSLWL